MAGKKARTNNHYSKKMNKYWSGRQDFFNKKKKIEKHIKFLEKKVEKLAETKPIRVERIKAEIEKCFALLEELSKKS